MARSTAAAWVGTCGLLSSSASWVGIIAWVASSFSASCAASGSGAARSRAATSASTRLPAASGMAALLSSRVACASLTGKLLHTSASANAAKMPLPMAPTRQSALNRRALVRRRPPPVWRARSPPAAGPGPPAHCRASKGRALILAHRWGAECGTQQQQHYRRRRQRSLGDAARQCSPVCGQLAQRLRQLLHKHAQSLCEVVHASESGPVPPRRRQVTGDGEEGSLDGASEGQHSSRGPRLRCRAHDGGRFWAQTGRLHAGRMCGLQVQSQARATPVQSIPKWEGGSGRPSADFPPLQAAHGARRVRRRQRACTHAGRQILSL